VALQDFVRRSSGEPLALPPASLDPQASAAVVAESQAAVARVTDEFRRFVFRHPRCILDGASAAVLRQLTADARENRAPVRRCSTARALAKFGCLEHMDWRV